MSAMAEAIRTFSASRAGVCLLVHQYHPRVIGGALLQAGQHLVEPVCATCCHSWCQLKSGKLGRPASATSSIIGVPTSRPQFKYFPKESTLTETSQSASAMVVNGAHFKPPCVTKERRWSSLSKYRSTAGPLASLRRSASPSSTWPPIA